MSEWRLRILVARGAAGGISATFNAPITGVFFGFELILREFSIDALLPIIVSSVLADIVGRAFFGAGAHLRPDAPQPGAAPRRRLPAGRPARTGRRPDRGRVQVRGSIGSRTSATGPGAVGREWCRPAVGGVVLGGLLLALPQLYGVGYPVMDKAVAGQYVLWFLLFLLAGKVVAASLTIGIGGSGGVFAPSLFTGAMAGTAFGVIAVHLFGTWVGSPAIYGVIAMGAVFAAAAQAPLTAIASVVEMTGNYTLTLPVMLAVGLARRSLQAADPRDHLHHEAPPPRHRYRPAQAILGGSKS